MNAVIDKVIDKLDELTTEFGGRIYHGTQKAISKYPAVVVLPDEEADTDITMGKRQETYRLGIWGYIEHEDTKANSVLIITLGKAVKQKLLDNQTLDDTVIEMTFFRNLHWVVESQGKKLFRAFEIGVQYFKEVQLWLLDKNHL